MPHQETAFRRQKAVLWAFVRFGRDGDPKVSDDPVEIRVRWNHERGDARDSQGNVVRFDASAIVDRRIEIHSKLALGTIEDWTDVGTADVDQQDIGSQEIMEVVFYDEVKDLKGRVVHREVLLKRFRDTMPHMVTVP